MTKVDKKLLRKNNIKTRLKRLKRLRELNVPLWVIKSEQIALFLNSRGIKHSGIGKDFSKLQTELYDKHVQPHLNRD